MSVAIDLPKVGSPDLPAVLMDYITPAVEARNIESVKWWIIDAYLRGLRNFWVEDVERGNLLSWEDEEDMVQLRWEEVLSRYETEVGRLSRLDLYPQADKIENTLESLRSSSLAQVVLDMQEVGHPTETMAIEFIGGLLRFGTYGIASWADESSENPLAIRRELIPPWELLGIPANYPNPTDRQMLIRTRAVPMAALLKIPDLKTLPSDEELQPFDTARGEQYDTFEYGLRDLPPAGGFGRLMNRVANLRAGRRAQLKKLRESHKIGKEHMVRLFECWTTGPRGLADRYIAMAGRAVLIDDDYASKNIQVPEPIGVARYHDIGRFYGRSWVGKVVPFAMQLESMFEQYIADVSDLHRFRYIMVPGASGLHTEDFANTTNQPKVLVWQGDTAFGDIKFQDLHPPVVSQAPAQGVTVGVNLMDRIVNQGPIYSGEAPGRSESGVSFQTLGQFGSTHLVPPARRIEGAYRAIYAHQLYLARKRLAGGNLSGGERPQFGLSATALTNSVAGISIDATTGKVIIDPEKLPDPTAVKIGVRSIDPDEKDRRRTEAIGLMREGLLTPIEFIIMNYQEGWGYPVGNRAVWENYLAAVLRNLIMFNNGVVPGGTDRQGTVFNEAFDRAEVQLLALEDFTAGPAFRLSSPEVKNVFFDRIVEVKAQMGLRIPRNAPTIDEAAVQRNAQLVQQQQALRGTPAAGQ